MQLREGGNTAWGKVEKAKNSDLEGRQRWEGTGKSRNRRGSKLEWGNRWKDERKWDEVIRSRNRRNTYVQRNNGREKRRGDSNEGKLWWLRTKEEIRVISEIHYKIQDEAFILIHGTCTRRFLFCLSLILRKFNQSHWFNGCSWWILANFCHFFMQYVAEKCSRINVFPQLS